nr:immunoglobulin heavy chain junction region [Macaca mulatta]MOV42758.1 immunoglobulin heavy chain junction region [Macaca mulatta]MOV42966.1 immunoglobulin heavy chain junction region [Macaca mulatta]MOV45173.1 immunoglobulin heavy chain junction region [Macaca mulatta]MOV46984.1 immunoglobulin heavy chain junction region [Macaca mulatta]
CTRGGTWTGYYFGYFDFW